MNINDFCRLLKMVRGRGKKLTACCPAHDDRNPSLSVCESDGRILIKCFAGCSNDAVLAAMGLDFADLFDRETNVSGNNGHHRTFGSIAAKSGDDERNNGGTKSEAFTPTRFYDYCEPDGRVRFQVVRSERVAESGEVEKTFRVRRKPKSGETAAADGWIYNAKRIDLIPYNLPGIADASLVYIVEGEKDVETLRGLGISATCNPFGAGKWRTEYSEWLRGKTVVILPDNDEQGQKHAEAVAASVYGVENEVLIIELPGLPEKGDVTDFVDAGGTADDLMDLVQRSEAWTPALTVTAENLSRFRFTTLDQLLSEPMEEISFVWDQTLPTGGFSICSAKPKVGKSTLARNLAVAVATGTPFLGRTTEKGRVLYLCLEEKRSEVRNHFERMGISSSDILIYTGATPEHAIREIGIAIGEFDPALVIIDPLSRVVRARDFNDYGQMSRELEPVIDLARRSGCHILALHHDSKMGGSGGDALLGSTALFGSVDCHIQLRKNAGTRTLNTTQRYGEDIPESVIELDKETGLVADSGSLGDFVRGKAKNAILAEIKPGEEIDETSIKARVDGFNRGTVAKAIRELVDERKMKRKGAGKKGDPYFYEIDDEWVM